MNELIVDLSEVLYALEWWKSDDTGEETYRSTVKDFKEKYFQKIDKLKERLIEEIKQEAIEEIKRL